MSRVTCTSHHMLNLPCYGEFNQLQLHFYTHNLHICLASPQHTGTRVGTQQQQQQQLNVINDPRPLMTLWKVWHICNTHNCPSVSMSLSVVNEPNDLLNVPLATCHPTPQSQHNHTMPCHAMTATRVRMMPTHLQPACQWTIQHTTTMTQWGDDSESNNSVNTTACHFHAISSCQWAQWLVHHLLLTTLYSQSQWDDHDHDHNTMRARPQWGGHHNSMMRGWQTQWLNQHATHCHLPPQQPQPQPWHDKEGDSTLKRTTSPTAHSTNHPTPSTAMTTTTTLQEQDHNGNHIHDMMKRRKAQ